MTQREEGRITNLSCVDRGKGWAPENRPEEYARSGSVLPRLEFHDITAWSGNGWGYDRGRNLSIS